MELFMPHSGFLYLYALLVGAFLGVIFDIFRIFRILRATRYRYIPTQKKSTAFSKTKQRLKTLKQKFRISKTVLEILLVALEDILFFVIAALTVILLLFSVNSGMIRGLALFCVFSGFLLYNQTIGRLVMRFAEYIVFALRFLCRQILRLLYKIVFCPIAFILKKLFVFLYTQWNRLFYRFKHLMWLKCRRKQTQKYLIRASQEAQNGYGFLKEMKFQ